MATKKQAASTRQDLGGHVFGRSRPNADGGFSLHTIPKRDTHFRELPNQIGRAHV